MDIDYDPAKARSNRVKHGVSFEEAATALLDSEALVREDPDAEGAHRWVLVGQSANGRLLTVVYALPPGRVRLIAARRATKGESKIYAQGI